MLFLIKDDTIFPPRKDSAGIIAGAVGGILLLGLAMGSVGCGEDFLRPGDETLIEGLVVVDVSVDPRKTPIDNLGLGLVYHVAAASPEGVLAPAQAEGITLIPPYPNPLTNPDGVPLTVKVEAERTVAARVEIWAQLRFFSQAVAVLESDSVAAGTTTYFWNGTEGGVGERVPNGLYFVRVTPAVGEAIEQPVVLNRSSADVIALTAYNEYSGFDGTYTLIDIAVGQTFVRTDPSGAAFGAGVLQNRVTLFTCDIDFLHYEEVVLIAPRERVSLEVSLIPRASAVAIPVS